MAVDEYNRRAIAALGNAQHLSGARSGNAFSRMLAERAHGSPSPSTYRRWIAGEAVVPAWAIQVAADVAETTVQALFEGGEAPVPDDWRARVEDAIGRLEGEMIEVRQQVGLPWRTGETGTIADQSDTLQQRSAD